MPDGKKTTRVKRPEILICDDCKVEGGTAAETTCPYASDIYGETVEVVLCDTCYHERCMDI